MSRIEIRQLSGEVETRELSKSQPLSIGRHASNDIVVDEESVASMHCRISWNKDQYEVVSANSDGVEVNGVLVQRSNLGAGDVLRVGTLDVLMSEDTSGMSTGSGQDSGSIGLKPLTEFDMVIPRAAAANAADKQPPAPKESAKPKEEKERKPKARKKTAKPKQPSPKKMKPESPDEEFDDWFNEDAAGNSIENKDDAIDDDGVDDDAIDDDDDWFSEAASEVPDERRDAQTPNNVVDAKPVETTKLKDEERPEDVFIKRSTGEAKSAATTIPDKPTGTALERLKTRFGSRPMRPGEQDALRSPFVMGLGIGALVLVLAAATVALTIGRDRSQRMYDAAIEDLSSGRYAEAISRFEDFLQEYPRNKYTNSAFFGLGKARVLREIGGSTPAWKRGLEAVQNFHQNNRDRDKFAEQHDDLRGYAKDIALGAAKTAELSKASVSKRRELLAVSADAAKVIDRFPADDRAVAEIFRQIEAATQKAEAAIRKQETFDSSVAEIEAAISEERPMAAFEVHIRLIEQYSDFEKNPKLVALHKRILETEQGLVTLEEVNRDALRTQRDQSSPNPLSLTLHTRSRTDEPSGRVVLAVAKDCCYGNDSVTGEPIWRRVIGLDSPFFPMRVQTSIAGLLVFDTNHRELLLLEYQTGRLFWRQPIEEDVAGPPFVHEGQIYLPTLANHLYKIELEAGKVSTRLTFSQKVLAPPVLDHSGKHLIVAGDQAVLYVLSLRPLECRNVSYLGHRADTIEAPLVTMGSLLLLTENAQMNRSRLRVLDTSQSDRHLTEVHSAFVEGTVRDRPTERGNQLFVTSSGERIASYTVSDDKEQKPLSPGPKYDGQSDYAGPMFVSAASDGQMWMMGSALRKFEVSTNTIKPDQKSLAVGISTQPLQLIGQYLYLGRRLPYSSSVFFTRANRQEMVGHWRTVLGASIKNWISSTDNSAVCITENGAIVRVTADEIKTGGFKLNAALQLPLPDDLAAPIRTAPLKSGWLGVHSDAPDPRLWIVNAQGQLVRQIRLQQPLQADPVLMPDGIVLALPGKLRVMSSRSGSKKIDDYIVPAGDEPQPKWSQLATLTEQEFIALDTKGTLVKIQLRKSPKPHMALVSTLKLDHPVDVKFHVHRGKIILADSKGRLLLFDAATSEPVASLEFERPVTGDLSLNGENLYVETGSNRLTCINLSGEIKERWHIPLEDAPLAGPPLAVNGTLVVAKQDGEILAVDAAKGTIRGRLNLEQPLSLGPMKIGELVVVPSTDGSLHHVESLLSQ